MARIFFPGCRIKNRYTAGSEKLAQYMQSRWGLSPVGCCKVDTELLSSDDTAVLICNNCSFELAKLGKDNPREFVYELIDSDESFPFPDYRGRKVAIQDCAHGYGKYNMDDTVRSLLGKMHIEFETLPIKVPAGAEDHMALAVQSASASHREVVTTCGICNLGILKSGRKSNLLLDLLFETEPV